MPDRSSECRCQDKIVDPPGPQRVPWLRFYQAVDEEIMALPGVRGVAWATTLPLVRSYQGSSGFEVVGDPPVADSQRPTADYQIISPSYFTTLDLPIIAGWGLTTAMHPQGVPVCIVNEALVWKHLRGRSPIGMRVAIRPAPQAQPVVREIVGVARQVKARPNETEDLTQIYVPLAQDTPGDIFLFVRPASGPAEALVSGVREAMARMDKQQLVSVRNVMTLDDVASVATSRHRFRAILVVAFAGLALLLAMAGVFGILAYTVNSVCVISACAGRLARPPATLLWIVAGSAGRVIATGALIGLALSAVLGRLLATALFRVQPSDPVTFASVTIVLALTAVVSTVGSRLVCNPHRSCSGVARRVIP